MNEKYQSSNPEEPNEDAKKWDILTEGSSGDDAEEAQESSYDFNPADGNAEFQMSVPEEDFSASETYDPNDPGDYDGHWRFDAMDRHEMRDEIRNTMRQRARLAKQGLTPMDVFCRMENTTPGSAYPEHKTASGIYNGQLDDLIELSIDEQTTAQEIMKLDRYSFQQVEYDTTLSGDQRRERTKEIDSAIFESFLEHAGKDFFARDDGSALQLLNLFLQNSRRYGFEHQLDMIGALKGKFTFGKSADTIISGLQKASSAEVANTGLGGEAFTNPEGAETLERGMSQDVKAGVVSAMIKDGSMAGVVDALPPEQLAALERGMSQEAKAGVVGAMIEDGSMADVVKALPPEQLATLLRLANARAADISSNDAQL